MDKTKTMNKADKNGALERCFMECSIRAINEESRTIQLSFSSETPYERWFGLEILSHEEDAVDLTRLNSIGCLLYNHNRDKVIGKILDARIEDGRGVATVQFDEDPESEIIYQKVKSGTLKGVSVGYLVDVWEEVEPNKKSSDGRFTGPCSIAKRWTPFEISIVSVPADPTVGVGRSQEETEPEPKSKGVSGFYYDEKQLQINTNLLKEVNSK